MHFALAFVGDNVVLPNTLIAFLLSGYGDFAVLQSRLHEQWSRFFWVDVLKNG